VGGVGRGRRPRGFLDGPDLALFLVGGFGPAIAALLMRLVLDRHAPPPIPGTARRPWWVWAPTAVILGAGPLLVGVLAGLPVGEGPIASVTADTIADAGGLATALAVILIGGPLSEEPGWRGYAAVRATTVAAAAEAAPRNLRTRLTDDRCRALSWACSTWV
jgi:membrane protease YdiL (CAAX protease family)